MNLPEDCYLAYTVNHEAWHYGLTRRPNEGPSLGVMAESRGGGVAWEFVITEHDLGGPTVRLGMFADAFDAFAQVPEFFVALTDRAPATLAEVRAILDGLGAQDVTSRVNPREVTR